MGIHHGVADAAQAGLDKIKPDEHDHTPPQNENPEQAAPGSSYTQDQTDTSESETDGDKKKGGFPWHMLHRPPGYRRHRFSGVVFPSPRTQIRGRRRGGPRAHGRRLKWLTEQP